MAYDPLSVSTRKSRTGVILFSVAAIAVEIFEVRIVDLPLSGIEIKFGAGLVQFVIGAGLVFHLASFSLYFLDDVSNEHAPPRLEAIRRLAENEIFQRNLDDLRAITNRTIEHIENQGLEKQLPDSSLLPDLRRLADIRAIRYPRSLVSIIRKIDSATLSEIREMEKRLRVYLENISSIYESADQHTRIELQELERRIPIALHHLNEIQQQIEVALRDRWIQPIRLKCYDFGLPFALASTAVGFCLVGTFGS